MIFSMWSRDHRVQKMKKFVLSKDLQKVVTLFCVFCHFCLLLACARATSQSAAETQPASKRQVILSQPADSVYAQPEMPLGREAELGKQAAEEIEREIGFVRDASMQEYVESIGQRIARVASRPDLTFQFRILDSPEPNAFALPGGYIYVSRGLLVLANSESELANVLAHEIAHVEKQHALARMDRAAQTNWLTTLGILAAAALGGGGDAIGAIQAANASAVAAYSREQEREADQLGQELSLRAGWDPRGMADFLRSLENRARFEQGASRYTGFFDSHPSTPERVALASSRADAALHTLETPLARNSFEYLQKVQGLVIGEDPAGGIFEGSRFLHPSLNFSIRFPEGWKAQNSLREVIAVSPRQAAMVRLRLQGEGDDPKAAAFRAVQNTQGLLYDGQTFRIGTLSAFHALSTDANILLDLTWIAYEGKIYRIEGHVPGQIYDTYRNTLRNVGRSFRSLLETERALFRTRVLRSVQANAGESLDELGRRTGNLWSPLETALQNGIAKDRPLEKGQWLKIAVWK